ncbi:MAG: tol-pal system protein YbgF [Gammaproteobacteria bacterium]|jgi:tol-pal system protein YbgF
MKTIIVVLCLIVPVAVFADEAPVVDLDSSSAQTPADNGATADQPVVPLAKQVQPVSTSSGMADQAMPTDINGRVARLEQQLNYLQQLNVPAKLDQLQQAIAVLRGLIDIQSKQLQQLETQQRTLYADLDKRIATLSGKPSATATQQTSDAASSAASETASTADSTADSTAATTDASAKETQAYQSVFSLIKDKRYTAAISSLKDYLRQYPEGKFVADAHYWLGELYIISGDSDNAIVEFNLVVNKYSSSCKAADSLLKLADIAFNNARFNQAKQYWQTIVSKYPNCSAARIASSKLQKLQQSAIVS